MYLSKFFLLILLLIIGTISTNSYANIVYENNLTIEVNYPVDKKKPVKKKRKKNHKKAQKKASFKIAKKIHKTQAIGSVLAMIFIALLLLLPVAFIIIGGITGGIGWLLAGFILMGLWLALGYALSFSQLTGLPYLGIIICLFFFLACFALFLWALITILPSIFILSIVFGCIAILGFLFLVFVTIMNVQ